VTIYDLSDAMRRRTIYADSGQMVLIDGSDLLLTLIHGYTQEVPAQNLLQLQRMFFERDYVRVRGVANQYESSNTEGFKGDREMSVCELQQEVARAEQEYRVAEVELRQARVAMLRERTTKVTQYVSPGAPLPKGSERGSQRLTLGRVYCDAMQRIGAKTLALGRWIAPNVAIAAVAQAQDTTRRRADSIASTQGGPPPPESPISPTTTPPPGPVAPQAAPSSGGGAIPAQAALESARLRTEQFRQAINQNEVEIHKKFAISIACIVFVLVGAPIAVRFPRGGVGLVMVFSLVIFAIYYIGLIAGESLADRGIMSPFWAMWATNIILTLVGLVLLSRMGRETATTRGGDFGDLAMTLRRFLFLGRQREAEAD